MWRYEGRDKRLCSLRHFLENLKAVCQMSVVSLAYLIFPIAILHLAYRDRLVRAVYQQVYLMEPVVKS